MILHCTEKLSGKLQDVSTTPLAETGPLRSWHARLFTLDRRQCVMFCHDESRYTLFLPGLRKVHFADLGRMHRDFFVATLATLGVKGISLHRAVMAMGPARFDLDTDKSVIDSLEAAQSGLGALLDDMNIMDCDPLALSLRLNERPVSVKGERVFPDKAMLKLVDRLSGSNGNNV